MFQMVATCTLGALSLVASVGLARKGGAFPGVGTTGSSPSLAVKTCNLNTQGRTSSSFLFFWGGGCFFLFFPGAAGSLLSYKNISSDRAGGINRKVKLLVCQENGPSPIVTKAHELGKSETWRKQKQKITS